jgi:hypothetical protein
MTCTAELVETVPYVDPWRERLVETPPATPDDGTEPWQPEFALAAVERARAFDLASDGASLHRTAFAASPAPTAVLD